jgi:predicted secreted protein
MTITAAIVLLATLWFLVLFCVLPIRFESQDEAGAVVPGTPRSAPHNLNLPRKLKITTAVALVVFVVLYGIIASGWITIDNMDVLGIMDRVPPAGG